MHSTIDVDIDAVPRAASSTTADVAHPAPRSREVRAGAGDLERAVPGIRARLKARYDELGATAVDECLSGAINASASFRLQEFRVILVERHAERDLRRLRQPPARRIRTRGEAT
jgi:hypothetical protein